MQGSPSRPRNSRWVSQSACDTEIANAGASPSILLYEAQTRVRASHSKEISTKGLMNVAAASQRWRVVPQTEGVVTVSAPKHQYCFAFGNAGRGGGGFAPTFAHADVTSAPAASIAARISLHFSSLRIGKANGVAIFVSFGARMTVAKALSCFSQASSSTLRFRLQLARVR